MLWCEVHLRHCSIISMSLVFVLGRSILPLEWCTVLAGAELISPGFGKCKKESMSPGSDVVRRPAAAPVFLNVESLFAHEAFIRARIACGEGYQVIAQKMLGDLGLHVKSSTMRSYLRRQSGGIFRAGRGKGGGCRRPSGNVTYLSISGLAAHDATISSIIDADPCIGYKALATKLAEVGIRVKLDTMKDYMKRISDVGVTYLSMSDLVAHEATISSIIDADPSLGYKAVVRKLAASGIHVKPKTMEKYMQRVMRASFRAL